MGMSIQVVGFRAPDEHFKKMEKVWDACKAAKIELPEEVDLFFDGLPPDDKGLVIDLGQEDGVTDWEGDNAEGYEVDVTKLPKDLTIIRFYKSW